MTSANLFCRISTLLEHGGIPYMLTGSFASSVYGMHRGSPDIDFIIVAEAAGVRRLFDHMPQLDFYSDLSQALDACRHQSIFNVLDDLTGFKIDFVFRKSGEFSQEGFKRRKKASVWGIPLYIATPEDVVIANLEWEKFGKSSRQIEDAAGILKVRGGELDLPYIQKWVDQLNLTAQWSQAKKLAGLE